VRWEAVRWRYQYTSSQMRRACKQVRKGRCPVWFELPAGELADAYLYLNERWRWRGPYGLVVVARAAVSADVGIAAGALIARGVPFWVPLGSLFLLTSVAVQLLGVHLYLISRDRWATAAQRSWSAERAASPGKQ
jgi:hypothetical protein